MSTEYICAACGQSFESEWSDDEANAEAARLFGVEGASEREDMAVVCDDCWENRALDDDPAPVVAHCEQCGEPILQGSGSAADSAAPVLTMHDGYLTRWIDDRLEQAPMSDDLYRQLIKTAEPLARHRLANSLDWSDTNQRTESRRPDCDCVYVTIAISVLGMQAYGRMFS